MTKMETINYILHYNFQELWNRLTTLLEQDRITTGAAYYVYNPFDNYSLCKIQELTTKASASKNFIRYIKRTDSLQFSVLLDMFNKDMDRIVTFIEEQENLPFEETQKQVLIRNGEISVESNFTTSLY